MKIKASYMMHLHGAPVEKVEEEKIDGEAPLITVRLLEDRGAFKKGDVLDVYSYELEDVA